MLEAAGAAGASLAGEGSGAEATRTGLAAEGSDDSDIENTSEGTTASLAAAAGAAWAAGLEACTPETGRLYCCALMDIGFIKTNLFVIYFHLIISSKGKKDNKEKGLNNGFPKY